MRSVTGEEKDRYLKEKDSNPSREAGKVEIPMKSLIRDGLRSC
jgi:hypothetical protein